VFLNNKIFKNQPSKSDYSSIINLPITPIFENPYDIPFLQNDFNGFKEAVALKESRGKYYIINSYGYLGKYQFGINTLKRFNIHNEEAFLNNPELQEKAFLALCKLNKWKLRNHINRHVGKTINGVVVTESGILAAAHLAGAGNVMKFLKNNGHNSTDAYGASVKYYMKRFGGFDVSDIKADRRAKV